MSGNRNHSRSRIAAWAELTGDDVPESIDEGGDGAVARDGTVARDAPEGYRGDRRREE